MTDRTNVFGAYRFFAFDGFDAVLWDRSITCRDDEDACDTAASLSDAGVTIEVWDAARLVGTCPATSLV